MYKNTSAFNSHIKYPCIQKSYKIPVHTKDSYKLPVVQGWNMGSQSTNVWNVYYCIKYICFLIFFGIPVLRKKEEKGGQLLIPLTIKSMYSTNNHKGG